MSSDGSVFTSDNLDEYLKEVAKEYRKMGGKFVPAEIILIGGANDSRRIFDCNEIALW